VGSFGAAGFSVSALISFVSVVATTPAEQPPKEEALSEAVPPAEIDLKLEKETQPDVLDSRGGQRSDFSRCSRLATVLFLLLRVSGLVLRGRGSASAAARELSSSDLLLYARLE
jgi:hypothetical protein